MRTRAGRASRGTAIARRLRLLAAFFTPALIAFSAAAAPPASASPPLARSAPSAVRLLVPEGTIPHTDQQFAEYAQQLFDDPMGHALLAAVYSFRFGGARPKSDPGNVSVEWFDFSWLPPSERNQIVNGLKAPNEAFENISGNYNIKVAGLGYAGNEKLYEQTGASLSAQLVQVSTYNAPKGAHSEEIPLQRLQAVIERVLQASGGSMSDAAAIAEANLII